ncbi:MAG: fused MFS/spermidine synthase [Anaerolineae bacterium]
METTQVPTQSATDQAIDLSPDGRLGHPAASPPTQTWLWRPNLIVFLSSACIMIIELVAGRMIAPYVGVSLYTWTSVIGVVLAGISLGNFAAGEIADRRASMPLLGGIFIAAGLASLSILLTINLLGSSLPDSWPVVLEILVLTCAVFFVPSAVLGAISPIVVKLAVQDLAETGSTVGRIYASSAVGSIAGTFATGFVLISWFGTYRIVWGVSVVLLALGLALMVGDRWRRLAVPALLVAAGSAFLWNQSWAWGPCLRETNYFCIKVHEEERDGESVRVLVLDRLVHSYTSLDDPTRLVYDYEKMYAELTAYKGQQRDQLKVLFIGGGGYTFPKYMEAVYPDSQLDVIEIDPGVTQVAYDLLGLNRDTRVVTYNQDARVFLERPAADRYDLILGDAFNDYSVPYHLTTKGFNDRVKAWLVGDGLYAVNMIDGHRGEFLRAYIHTLRQTFNYVYVAPTIAGWRESSRSTFVLVATDTPMDRAAFGTIDGGDGDALFAQRVLIKQEIDEILSEGRVVTLTDQYAPVDQMLAPVFRGEEPAR